MKRSQQMPALLHQDRVPVIGSQHFSARSHAPDDWGANEDCFEIAWLRTLRKTGFRRDLRHAAVDLAAIRVALHGQVHQTEALLGRMGDLRGKQDGAGASTENRAFLPE